jgi:hypothetical protein
MKAYQERVVEEKKELDKKIEALDNFVNANEAYADLDEEEQDRLTAQRTAMGEYSDILGERIEAFVDDDEEVEDDEG